METYESNGFPQGPEHTAPSPKKESPFANSPYATFRTDPGSVEPRLTPPVSPMADIPPVPPLPSETPAACETPAPKAKNSSNKGLKIVLAALLIVALVAGACAITASSINAGWQAHSDLLQQQIDRLYDHIDDLEEQIKDNSYTGNGNSVSGTPNTSPDGMTPGQVYAACYKSVVQITTSVASGSGFILSEEGYVVTNYHVIEGGNNFKVILYDGTEYSAKLVGSHSTNDLAILKITASGLNAVKLGSSTNLIVGDQVVAIGNPLGLTNIMTAGIVSAKDQVVSTDGNVISMLQTDAAINSGNSGGPLFNMKGEVVGITTAKYSGASSSGASIEGIGFAIPIDDVKDMFDEIIRTGKVSTPYLGVMVIDQGNGFGVYVDSVEPDGAAYAAGVKAKDYIVGLGEYDITSMEDLSLALKKFKVGDTTTISVYRNRKVLDLTITFGERPADDNTSSGSFIPDDSDVPENGSYDEWYDHFFGDEN